jgi:hypothetical protein
MQCLCFQTKKQLRFLECVVVKLEVDEGRVYGSRYYTVHPIIGWDDLASWPNMVEWCKQTFGPTAKDGIWTPGMRWYVNNARFYFRTEADRDWFLLRWA